VCLLQVFDPLEVEVCHSFVAQGLTAARAKVIVVGGELVMGRSLEVVLLAAGYDSRLRPEPSADELEELLGDARLLLVAPGLSAGSRNTLTEVVMRTATKIPVLELRPANGGEAVGIQGADPVPWPCTLEELQPKVQSALLTRG
jgi:hypothetical protein